MYETSANNLASGAVASTSSASGAVASTSSATAPKKDLPLHSGNKAAHPLDDLLLAGGV